MDNVMQRDRTNTCKKTAFQSSVSSLSVMCLCHSQCASTEWFYRVKDAIGYLPFLVHVQQRSMNRLRGWVYYPYPKQKKNEYKLFFSSWPCSTMPWGGECGEKCDCVAPSQEHRTTALFSKVFVSHILWHIQKRD